jgi:aryl-alcohol dehydrogenase-like predicted oxidoreductase
MASKREIDRRTLFKGTLAGAGALGLGAPGRALAQAGTAAGEMPTVVFGRTGQRIPTLVFGTSFRLTLPLLKRAVDLGVTYLDLADCYMGGGSERVAGDFLQKTGLRKRIWITTKSDAHDPDGLERTLAGSLGRIQVDQVDLLFLHNLEDPAHLSPAMRARAEKLKREGKIRFFGFSTHASTVVETMQLAARLGWVDAIMFKYNFRSYGDKPLNDAIDACKKANIGLIAMKTQGSHYSFAQRVPPFQARGFTKHQAVLKAVWQDTRIDAIVSEMTNFEQLEQNVAAALDRTRLGALELDGLRRHAAATEHLYCQGCEQHCRPALDRPVRVADTLRLLMYHDEYGEAERAKRLFAAMPPEERALGEVDFAPAARACPHGLDVVALMERARRVLAV